MLHNQVLTVLFLKIFSGLSYILYTCIMLFYHFLIFSFNHAFAVMSPVIIIYIKLQ